MLSSGLLAGLLLAVGACSPSSPPPTIPPTHDPAPAASPPSDASPVIRREIRVRVACDEEFRAMPDWEAVARRRIAAASRAFEEQLQIRWSVADVVEWKSDDAAQYMIALTKSLARDVSGGSCEIVVGFSGQLRATGMDHDYVENGCGLFYGPAATVRQMRDAYEERWYVACLVHELGHVLGAWHSSDASSVMFREATYALEFDSTSLRTMEILRDFDFRTGVDGLSDDLRRRIAEVYRQSHAPGDPLPFVYVDLDRARELFCAAQIEEARASARKALAAQEACVSADDRTLVPGLRAVARSLLEEPRRDLAEAERLAGRACAISAKAPTDEFPLLDSRLVLAEIVGRRGRYAEAIEETRRVHDERAKALGDGDVNTVHAQAWLEYWQKMAASSAANSR
jgi:hypothetical protein